MKNILKIREVMEVVYSTLVVAILVAIAICIYNFRSVARGLAEPDDALAQFLTVTEQGDAETQFQLAGMYYNGKGVPQNYVETLKWLRKAAEQGHVGAYYRLGDVYRIGRGVPEDRAESAKWYRKAAEQGHVEAQIFLQIYADEKVDVAKVW